MVGYSPWPPHSIFKVWHCAVVQHNVTWNVQWHQIDQTLYNGCEDFPGHLKLRGSSALTGDVKMPRNVLNYISDSILFKYSWPHTGNRLSIWVIIVIIVCWIYLYVVLTFFDLIIIITFEMNVLHCMILTLALHIPLQGFVSPVSIQSMFWGIGCRWLLWREGLGTPETLIPRKQSQQPQCLWMREHGCIALFATELLSMHYVFRSL